MAMMAEFVRGKYSTMPYTPGADMAAGDVIIVGDRVCICNQPGGVASGRFASLATRGGLYKVKVDGAIGVGKKVYWDATNVKVTLTATGNKVFGITCNKASTADGQFIEVEHDPAA